MAKQANGSMEQAEETVRRMIREMGSSDRMLLAQMDAVVAGH